ncbi:glycosyltransferase family 2 protein [Loktanella sp. S4079]|uniref:glycosyltransferase family 2 protein n=1 Tax=Loktanella sp. S4079 TaxID=579483 RepID=UPI0005F9EAD9|nr:glycosyltransferase family 2 protein [Loktanella sp. S4079]KJZ18501.1 hypothetical protein TW80_13780 [Loktanella sp. S4079]
MTPPPFVSVIIAAHDAAFFVQKAIDSALAQSGAHIEVIVVDDASTDDTRSVIHSLAAQNDAIVPISSPTNLGPGGARNLALARAKGDWIAVLDSDDSFAPDRLANMVHAAKRADADIVIDDFVSMRPDGEILEEPSLSDRRSAGAITLADWVGLNVMERGELSFGYAKPLISREFLVKSGVTYNAALRNGEDFHLVLASLIAGAKLHFTAMPGYHYTRRAGSVSARARHDHLRALLDADDVAGRQLDANAQAVALRFLARRRKNIERLMTTESIMGDLKAKRFGGAVAQLLRHPATTGRLIGHLAEAVGKRIGANQ